MSIKHSKLREVFVFNILFLVLFLLSCINKTTNSYNKNDNPNDSLLTNVITFDTILSNQSNLRLNLEFDGLDSEAPFYRMARLYINDSLCFNDSESFEYIEIIDTIKFIIYNNVNYLFVPYRDRPDPNSWHIFVIENDILKEEKIIQADIGMNFKDYDNDGLIEFGGLPQFHEAYCFDCDSVYYNSNIIYEISDAILLDTMLSIENNKKYYGKHIDFSRGCYTVTSNEQK